MHNALRKLTVKLSAGFSLPHVRWLVCYKGLLITESTVCCFYSVLSSSKVYAFVLKPICSNTFINTIIKHVLMPANYRVCVRQTNSWA